MQERYGIVATYEENDRSHSLGNDLRADLVHQREDL
jgi:hypothetical protein